MSSLEEVSDSKSAWRRTLLEERRSASPTRSAESTTLRTTMQRWIDAHRVETVCAYVPVGREPGSLELLDDLRDTGYRVLLPVVVGQAPLDWAEYTGPRSLESADLGLLEPVGERVGPDAIAGADLVMVPALAVDHQGRRLGRGGGYYDRSLPLASDTATLIAIVRDSEFVVELPGEGHDVAMSAVATPGNGVLDLPM